MWGWWRRAWKFCTASCVCFDGYDGDDGGNSEKKIDEDAQQWLWNQRLSRYDDLKIGLFSVHAAIKFGAQLLERQSPPNVVCLRSLQGKITFYGSKKKISSIFFGCCGRIETLVQTRPIAYGGMS